MTQRVGKTSPTAAKFFAEKRNVSGVSTASTNRSGKESNNHFNQKLRNFFRISSNGSNQSNNNSASNNTTSTPQKPEKTSFRQSRFLPNMSRNRSTTVHSEGNALDDASPTAHANPYFAHQGMPALRHHNEGSVPSSPPETPTSASRTGQGFSGANDQATAAGKEELARKLRRVASAPNAQGLFAGKAGTNERPSTANLSKEQMIHHSNDSSISVTDDGGHLVVPPGPGALPTPGQIRESVAFRRTYSSNSIKVRDVEVGPSSFDKIKLIGKGDVGKVYLVREKKSSRLYAMKGEASRIRSTAWICVMRSVLT